MQDFKKLKVWEKAHGLALDTYRCTSSFSRDERFELTRQMRSSATSIPTNIAEGCGRNGRVEFARFLTIAGGSASELEYQVLLARDLGFLSSDTHLDLTRKTREVKKMIVALVRGLRTDD